MTDKSFTPTRTSKRPSYEIVFTSKCEKLYNFVLNFEHAYTVTKVKLKIDVACFNLQTYQLSVFQLSRLCW